MNRLAGAQRDRFAGAQHRRLTTNDDVRTVARAEIDVGPAAAVASQERVHTRDAVVVQAQVHLVRAPDQHRRLSLLQRDDQRRQPMAVHADADDVFGAFVVDVAVVGTNGCCSCVIKETAHALPPRAA